MKDLVDNLNDLDGMDVEWRAKEMTLEDYIKEGKWVCADGRVTPIEEMSDSHLEKAINIIRKGELDRQWALPYLESEQRIRAKKSDIRDSLVELKRRIENALLYISAISEDDLASRRSRFVGNELLHIADKMEQLVYCDNERRF